MLNVAVDISGTDTDNSRLPAGSIRAAVKKEMRRMENKEDWRCWAVTVDHATQSRTRIACRDEDEH